MRPKGNSNLRNGFWKDHPCGCTCPSEASDLAQSLYERGLSADLKQSAQGVSIEINKDPGVCWGQRLAGTFFTHHLSLFWNSRLFPSPPGGGAIFIFPLSHLPSHKTWPFFPLPQALSLRSSSALLQPAVTIPPSFSATLQSPLSKGTFYMFPGLWAFPSGSVYCGCHSRPSPDHLALEIRGTALWDYKNQRHGSWRITTPRH